MIELKGLKKTFGKLSVFKGLDLTIPKGQITVIIGRSGEGKSVLLKHMIGLVAPDEGEIIIDGQSILSLDEYKMNAVRKKFGMLFQNGALFDSMTIFENVAFPLKEHSDLTPKQRHERVKDLLNIVGLRPTVINNYPAELSGGMRKRVALARAIALEPQILLYDEPTTGLDPIMTDVVDHLILSTQKKLGITSVVISHDMQAVFEVADKIAMLHEGKVLMEGSVEEFQKSDHAFIKSFLSGKASQDQLESL